MYVLKVTNTRASVLCKCQNLDYNFISVKNEGNTFSIIQCLSRLYLNFLQFVQEFASSLCCGVYTHNDSFISFDLILLIKIATALRRNQINIFTPFHNWGLLPCEHFFPRALFFLYAPFYYCYCYNMKQFCLVYFHNSYLFTLNANLNLITSYKRLLSFVSAEPIQSCAFLTASGSLLFYTNIIITHSCVIFYLYFNVKLSMKILS